MKATSIGKTIIVWDKISNNEVVQLVNALKNLLSIYKSNFDTFSKQAKTIPIQLPNSDGFVAICKKHEEIVISYSKQEIFHYSPILNGDALFRHIKTLENCGDLLNKRIQRSLQFSDLEWVNLPFNQSFETYALTPNMNPEDFIKNLEKGTLSNMQKNFLKEVGFALENSNFSKKLEDAIKDANDLFAER